MLKEIKSSKTFQKSLRVFKEFNLKVRILIGLKKVKLQNDDSGHQNNFISINKKAFILTPPGFYFIAKLIQKHLAVFSIESEIIDNEPQFGFNSELHFVICPQLFKKLPDKYLAFQMEALKDLKWMDADYLEILKNAKCIFDSSLQNIDFLQNNNVPFRQIFYLPIYHCQCEVGNYENKEEYDIAFYSNINIERCKKYLDALISKFSVKVIDHVYGEELYDELSKARVVVNIHDNMDSCLETIKVYECLSLNKLLILETAKDLGEYQNLIDIVEFTAIGNISEMIEKISYWLENDTARLEKISQNTIKLKGEQNLFSYYFNRFLLSNNVIDYKAFVQNTSHPRLKNNFVCLSLPETPLRILSFTKENKDAQIFNGLRHTIGWIGCGLSYKYILHLAKQHQFDYIIVCEDDVEFYPDFDSHLAIITSYLNQNLDNWDLFSGFIADVHREMEVTKIDLFHEKEFVYIDKLMSTVFNIYNKSFFDKLEDWDQNDFNKETNTIDRFIESRGSLRIVTTLPYLVGHKEELPSSIWNNVQNTDFTRQINKSTTLLRSKINFYKKMNKVKLFFTPW